MYSFLIQTRIIQGFSNIFWEILAMFMGYFSVFSTVKHKWSHRVRSFNSCGIRSPCSTSHPYTWCIFLKCFSVSPIWLNDSHCRYFFFLLDEPNIHKWLELGSSYKNIPHFCHFTVYHTEKKIYTCYLESRLWL